MTSFNSQICKKDNKFKIQYETNNFEFYKHIQKEIRKQIDKEEKINGSKKIWNLIRLNIIIY